MSDQKSPLVVKTDDHVVADVVAEVSKLYDAKSMTDKTKLASVLVKTMQYVGTTYPKMDGQQKKQLVIAALQAMCPSDAIDLIIPGFVDMLVEVDKDNIKINPVIAQKVQSCFARICSCCSSKKKTVTPSTTVTPPSQ